MEYGFHWGINLNTAYGSAIDKNHRSSLTGVSIGGHLKIRKSEHVGLKILLAYDQYGWTYKSLQFENSTATGFVDADVLFKLNYLNLPVMAEYSFGKKVKINLDGGLFLGVLLNNEVVTKLKKPIPPNEEAITSFSSNSRSAANFGVCFGVGIQIPISSKVKVDFDLKNSTGLSNVNKSNATYSSTTKTNSITILGGLTFEL